MTHPSRRARRVAAAVVLTLVVATAASCVPSSAGPTRALGVFVGGDRAKVSAFGQWVGRPVSVAHSFFPSSSWATMKQSATWQIEGWRGAPFTPVYSIPMLVNDGGTLARGAQGAYDGHFREIARLLVANGQGRAIVRPGWEHNGGWFRWSSLRDPNAYAAYFRRIVTAMRSVPGASSLRFDWCVAGMGAVNPASYPGDAYVTYIGMDVYDQSFSAAAKDPVARWSSYLSRPSGGLRWHRDFAAAHRKPMSFPEWAVSSGPHVSGAVSDNPYFIRQMHGWINSNNVAYAAYFNVDSADGQHSLYTGRFPKAAAEMRARF